MLLLAGDTAKVLGLSYSPDGRALCSWGADGMRMWDLSAGAGQAKQREGFAGTDPCATAEVSWSSDCARLSLRTGGLDASILDAHTGEVVRVITYPDAYPESLAFTPGGRLFVVVSGQPDDQDTSAGDWIRLELCDSEGDTVQFAKHIREGIAGIDQPVIPDADDRHVYFVVGYYDVFRWTPRTGEVDSLFTQRIGITGLAVSADESLALTRGGKSVYLWPLRRGNNQTLKHPLTCSGATFLPNGRVLTACYDGIVRVWDASSATEVHAFDLGMGRVYCLAVSPDHMTFAAGVHKKSRIVLMDVPE